MKKLFVEIAVLLLLLWLGFSWLGYAEYTSVLSGTPPTNGMRMGDAALRAIAYGLSYFASIILAPPLLVSAAVLHLNERRVAARVPIARSSAMPRATNDE